MRPNLEKPLINLVLGFATIMSQLTAKGRPAPAQTPLMAPMTTFELF